MSKKRRREEAAAAARAAFDAWEAAKLQQTVPVHLAGIVVKPAETVYAVVPGVGLIEPRRSPGQWVAGSSGTSVRVMERLTVRTSSSMGTYVQGQERHTIIDTGVMVVTDVRCVFVGGKRTVQWPYSRLVAFSLDGPGVALFNISNRQAVGGIAYAPSLEPMIDAIVAAAITKSTYGREAHRELVEGMRDDYAAAWHAWQALEPQSSRMTMEVGGAAF